MVASNHVLSKRIRRVETIDLVQFDGRLNRSKKGLSYLPCRLTPVRVRKRLRSRFNGSDGHCEIKWTRERVRR